MTPENVTVTVICEEAGLEESWDTFTTPRVGETVETREYRTESGRSKAHNHLWWTVVDVVHHLPGRAPNGRIYSSRFVTVHVKPSESRR